MKIRHLWMPLVCALQPLLPAQDLEITTVDGQRIRAVVRGLSGKGESAVLEVTTAEGEQTLPLASVLGLHGPGPRPVAGPVVHLVGGDELRGAIRAGDSSGETFLVESASLGRIAIQVDRLSEMVLGQGAGPGDLRIPDSADEDEALFLPTGRARLDIVMGALHRFTDSGVVFEESDRNPREFAYGELAGIALRGGLQREGPAPVQLITRTGDSVGGKLLGIGQGRFRIALEGDQEVELPVTEIAALTFRGEDRAFLSDLEPREVEESSYFGDGTEPLYPFRRDRTVTGNFLVAEGHTHGKGLGVHSKSRLSFQVPRGFSRFYCLVAVDDEVKALGLRADVNVRVLLGKQVMFEAEGLAGGAPVREVGMLDVSSGGLITLEVDFGKGMGLADRVDWLLAVFLR